MLNKFKNWLGTFMMTKDDVQDLHRKLDLVERKIAAQKGTPGESKNSSAKTRTKRSSK